MLNDIQIDAVTEILNIGLGSAAAALSEMVEEEVILSIPSVEVIDRASAAKIVGAGGIDAVSAVHQEFSGPIWGNALLFFPEEQSMELVRAVLKNTMPLESLSEMEQEGMTEIGNVILNACLSSFADIFQNQIETNIPIFFQGNVNDLFQLQSDDNDIDETTLLLRMEFTIKHKEINGFISFLMSISSINSFLDSIDQYLDIDVA